MPTGGAAGTGVSEAKLNPTTGQPVAATAGTGIPTTPTLTPAAIADSVMVRELAVADLLKLTQILQPASPPDKIAKVDQLVQQTVEAIAEGRVEWAVGRVVEAAMADPSRVEELRAKPEFEPIRSNVEQLLGRLTNVAKMDAETKLSAAEQLIDESGIKRLPHWETSPEALVNLGHRLIEAGGYANYVRTSELATNLQSAYWGATIMQPVPNTPTVAKAAGNADEATVKRKRTFQAMQALAYHAWDTLSEKLPPGVSKLWSRAPLLALLLGWLLLGITVMGFSRLVLGTPVSDVAAEIWAVGFLALVGFGFWARLRPPRSRS